MIDELFREHKFNEDRLKVLHTLLSSSCWLSPRRDYLLAGWTCLLMRLHNTGKGG